MEAAKPNSALADSEADSNPLRVSIQGVPGSFHDIAARFYFPGRSISLSPALTFAELVRQIESGEADTGLMAIENTLAGSLMANYKLLNQASLRITGEIFLRIKQNLLVLPGQQLADLKEVHSHPIAIEQCREFFQHYPNIRLVEVEDTALAAKNVQQHQLTGIGAIASATAAGMYALDVLAPSIETNKLNFTRFLVLERAAEARVVEGADKVSLHFATGHEVGSLYKVLAVLAAYGVNLTKIQSAPIIGKPWEYMFYVDFVAEGSLGFEQAIDAIRPLTKELKILGTYKQGQPYED